MGLAATQVTGTEKQGLGYCLIVEGKIWPAKINDPGSLTFTRNKLDATHSKTEDFKQEKFEELAEPLEQDLTTFFDPTLAEAFEIMGTDGATKKREIYLCFPRTPVANGDAVRENGFIYLPEGLIAADSIAMPLNELMTQEVNVNGGTANPTLRKEGDLDLTVLLPATSVTFTSTPATLVGPIAAGTVVGKLTTDIANEDDVSLFFNLAGTDASDFELDGHFVVAKNQLTNTGGGGDGIYDLTVSTSNLVGYDEQISAFTLANDAFTVTVT
jgi:hypothetical protein